MLVLGLLAVRGEPAEMTHAETDFRKWRIADEPPDSNGPRFLLPERVGEPSTENGVSCRALDISPAPPRAFPFGPCAFLFEFPAFNFDADNYGAAGHSFFMAIRFKDVLSQKARLYSFRGGSDRDGLSGCGFFGGDGDNEWKTAVLVIPRSQMRCADSKHFCFALLGQDKSLPVEWIVLFSHASQGLPEKDRWIQDAFRLEADIRKSTIQSLLPDFKDLGLPKPETPPPYTDAEKKRRFRAFFPPISRRLFANSEPLEGELTDTPALGACPGEATTLVVCVRALEALGKVSVELSGLPDARAQVRWATYSPQRIGASWGDTYQVCPEHLVEVDAFDVEPETLAVACITLEVDENAAPGDCSGTLRVKTENAGRTDFPVDLKVYPFLLEHPDHSTHGLFHYNYQGDYSPFELADMRDHGMDTIVMHLVPPMWAGPDSAIELDMAPVEACFQELKTLGYTSPIICNSFNIYDDTAQYGSFEQHSDEHRRAYARVVENIVEAGRKAGFPEVGFFPVDEPYTEDRQKAALLTCAWTADVPAAKTFITTNPTAQNALEPLLDYCCWQLSWVNEHSITQTAEAGKTLMFYCPAFDVDPSKNRFRAGFYLFKTGVHTAYFFAYYCPSGDVFIDLDGPHRDWNVVYPSLTSPRHDSTLQWEAMREGVNDYRYAYTLQSTAGRAEDAGHEKEAAHARKILDDILAPVSVDGKAAHDDPALIIEGDLTLRDTAVSESDLRAMRDKTAAAWYDTARRTIAQTIVALKEKAGV